MSINGNLYDWESIEIQGPNGITAGMTEIQYSDERPVQVRHGKGSTARGYGLKNYTAQGSGNMDKDEHARLRQALGGSLYTGSPFNIVVSYANQDQSTITDTLKGVLVTKQENASKQEDDSAGQIKIDFVMVQPIEWGGVVAYKDGRNGSPGN